MKAYAIHHPRNFSNEFEIIAFESRSARNAYVKSDPGGDSAVTHSITRAKARQMLEPNWLSPSTGGLNCYLGGHEGVEEDYRREDCHNRIIAAIDYNRLPDGACETPVRL